MKNTTSHNNEIPASTSTGTAEQQNNQTIDLEKVHELSCQLLRKQWGGDKQDVHLARNTRTGKLVGKLTDQFRKPVWRKGFEPLQTSEVEAKIEAAKVDTWREYCQEMIEVIESAVSVGHFSDAELTCFEFGGRLQDPTPLTDYAEEGVDRIRTPMEAAFCFLADAARYHAMAR